ncbi:MAG: hypothetical protein B7X06_00855, partial [Verrucomicrobia bacterium 21-51-4]
MIQSSELRLHKHLANNGLCSRRDAEEWIREGRIIVNGALATIGQTIDPARDKVYVDGKPMRPAPGSNTILGFLVNKPRGYLCSHSDPHNSKVIYDLLPKEYRRLKLFCAGRLDKDSEGLVILTNKGAFAQAITHPSFEVIKRYQVILHRPFNPADLSRLLKGVVVEGEHLIAQRIIIPKGADETNKRLEVHLAQGRKREIRRLFEALGYF